MKNTLLAIVVLIGLCGSARAQVITNAQPVWSAVKFKTTCSSTTIGITSVELTGNTTSPANTGGISQIKVVNADPTATICCGPASTVTCVTGAATDGDPIFAVSGGQKNFASWPISITQPWSCISTIAGAGAIVCKVR